MLLSLFTQDFAWGISLFCRCDKWLFGRCLYSGATDRRPLFSSCPPPKSLKTQPRYTHPSHTPRPYRVLSGEISLRGWPVSQGMYCLPVTTTWAKALYFVRGSGHKSQILGFSIRSWRSSKGLDVNDCISYNLRLKVEQGGWILAPPIFWPLLTFPQVYLW